MKLLHSEGSVCCAHPQILNNATWYRDMSLLRFLSTLCLAVVPFEFQQLVGALAAVYGIVLLPALGCFQYHAASCCFDQLSVLAGDVGTQFRLSSMTARDVVRSRVESGMLRLYTAVGDQPMFLLVGDGISYTEFSYQLLQAYDFAYLYEHHDCRLQVSPSQPSSRLQLSSTPPYLPTLPKPKPIPSHPSPA